MHTSHSIASPKPAALERSVLALSHASGLSILARSSPSCHSAPMMALAGQWATHSSHKPQRDASTACATGKGASVMTLERRNAPPKPSEMSSPDFPIQPRPARVATVLCGKSLMKFAASVMADREKHARCPRSIRKSTHRWRSFTREARTDLVFSRNACEGTSRSPSRRKGSSATPIEIPIGYPSLFEPGTCSIEPHPTTDAPLPRRNACRSPHRFLSGLLVILHCQADRRVRLDAPPTQSRSGRCSVFSSFRFIKPASVVRNPHVA